MEDFKKMFAQMMKIQRESHQKMRKKLLQHQKENEVRILKKKRKNINFRKKTEKECLNNVEKQLRFFLELQKQQEALFKSVSNNQPTDSTCIFAQKAVWDALETFSYAPDWDKTIEAYYRR